MTEAREGKGAHQARRARSWPAACQPPPRLLHQRKPAALEATHFPTQTPPQRPLARTCAATLSGSRPVPEPPTKMSGA